VLGGGSLWLLKELIAVAGKPRRGTVVSRQ
jgi:hypothetical protein